MLEQRNQRSSPRVVVLSSPSTKGAGAYQLWDNYEDPIRAQISDLSLLRGHSQYDGVENPQLKLNLRSAIWMVTKLRGMVSRGGAQSVVTSISQSDILYGLFVRSFCKASWTIYVLGQPYPVRGQTGRLKSFIWKRLWLLAARRADKIIAVSNYIAVLISKELPGRHIETIYPALRGAPARVINHSIAGAPLRAGFVGRLSPEKDPALFCKVMESVEGIEAKVFGDGPMRDEIERDCVNVKFLGFRSQEEIYSGIDILVMTSKSEGLPMVLVEASSCGVVPLVVDVGGCAEAIHPDNRAVLVIANEDRENGLVWRDRLHMLKDPTTRDEISRRQAEWAADKFDLVKNTSRLVAAMMQGESDVQ